jgi:hypothetical protein
MPMSPSELEAQVQGLADTVRRLEGRVLELEQAGAGARARRAAAAHGNASAAARARSDVIAVAATAPLVGRTLLVLAGAFVLRALTDAGTLPGWLGVALGLAYAGAWLALADRAGGAGAAASAGFHALSAVVIGFPLLFEAGSRLHLLGPAAAAALLAALTAGALAVAARRRREGLAWIAALGGAVTAVALAASAGRAAPAALYLVALGTAALWLGYVLDWFALRWPVALIADGVVAVLALGAGTGRTPDSPGAALWVLGALVAAYLGSIAARTLLLGRRVVAFEVVQAIAAVALGLGGAAHVTRRAGMGSAPVGLVSLLFGVAAYAVAFAFLERRARGRANFYFYTSAALAFVLGGGVLLLAPAPLGLACAALAVGAGWLARHYGRLTLAVHGALYALAAALATGLLARASLALIGAPGSLGEAVAPLPALALAAGAATAWLCAAAPPREGAERVAQLALLAAVAFAAAGLAGGLLAPLAGAADAGAIAALRTVVLAAAALALAALGRDAAWLEARWLAYPVLGVAGLKVLLEDLPRGRPASLFLSFAAFGAVLLLVPRLRRRVAAQAGGG